MLDQRPNMKGFGGIRLGDQAPVPMLGGGDHPSVSCRERLWHHLGHTLIKIGGVVMSSVVTSYKSDLVTKVYKTY